MEEAVVRYFHFIGILVMFAALLVEHLCLKAQMNAQEIKKVAIVDMIFGLSAVITLAAGLALWLWVGKAAEFYTSNGLFHVKLSLFVLIAALSIYPTLFFIKSRKSTQNVIDVPKTVIMLIRAEMALFLVMPLLAVLVARGTGIA